VTVGLCLNAADSSQVLNLLLNNKYVGLGYMQCYSIDSYKLQFNMSINEIFYVLSKDDCI